MATLSLPELLTQQIDMLNAQLQRCWAGCARLTIEAARETLASGNEPESGVLAMTLELMKMYDRWFVNRS